MLKRCFECGHHHGGEGGDDINDDERFIDADLHVKFDSYNADIHIVREGAYILID